MLDVLSLIFFFEIYAMINLYVTNQGFFNKQLIFKYTILKYFEYDFIILINIYLMFIDNYKVQLIMLRYFTYVVFVIGN